MTDIMARHLGNLSRANGGSGSGDRYDYILSQNDLQAALNEAHAQAKETYALKKQTGRNRFLLANEVEIEQIVQNILAESVQETGTEISNIVVQDSVNMIYSLLNGVVSGGWTSGSSGSSSKSFDLAKELGRGLANMIPKTIDAIHKENKKK